MHSWDLNGKRALITGGSKGIGKAIVGEFLALGAEILFTGRNAGDVAAVEEEFRQHGHRIHGLVSDVVLEAERAKLVEWIGREWGFLDILVNNAGMNIRKRATGYSREEYMEVLEIDLFAAFEFCRALLPLLQQGHGPSVINVASVAGSYDLYTGPPYGMAKAGLIQLTRSLAVEWARYPIRVNAVSPWFTETPMIKGIMEDAQRSGTIIAATPLRRLGQAGEVAAAVAFLAMDKASYITGHNLSVDGGVTSRLM